MNPNTWYDKLILMVVWKMDWGGESGGSCQSAGCPVAQAREDGLLPDPATWRCTDQWAGEQSWCEVDIINLIYRWINRGLFGALLCYARHSHLFGAALSWQPCWFSMIRTRTASASHFPVFKLCRACWCFCVRLAVVFHGALMTPRPQGCLLYTRRLKRLLTYHGIF